MARNEADREDLIREAVAMPRRVELRVPGFAELVTIGFRVTSAMSVFVGQDPVYQFDPDGRLRRAYRDGFLFRSEHSTLARLERVRTEAETRLMRDDLTAEQLQVFRKEMTEVLKVIAAHVKDGTVEVLRTASDLPDLLPEILRACDVIFQADPWLSPQIRRRVIR